jgi:Ca2+-binding RTX toxin-like protein
VVGTVMVTDPDLPNDTFTFSLLDDGDGRFAIDANTGVVTVVGPLDFETDPTFAIEVLVTDSDDNTFSDTLVIDIGDVDGNTIKGSTKNDTINGTRSVKGQPKATIEEDNISGGRGNDKISSLGGNDIVKGGAGNDKMNGGDGDDVLRGGVGNDKLTDGLGNDILTGNAGVDRFIFSQFVDDASLVTLGTITDFKHRQHDKIDLHLIDADDNALNGNQAFTFLGDNGTFTNEAGELRFVTATHTLEGDTDGDGNADFAVVLNNVNHLVRGDFVL